MPSIPSFLKSKSKPPQPITTYYLSSPSSSSSTYDTLLRPIPPPNSPQTIPRDTLIFSFTHPPLSNSQATSFFLECIPDPIGFLYHSSSFISKNLILNEKPEEIEWRHQLITLELENKDGLAATSGGKISISLKWVEEILNQVKKGNKTYENSIKEFKGVLLHELVHTIQHDGFGSTPGWLIESIADYIRLQANLNPDHWRKSGSGNKEKGYEDGYDIGAKFLQWLIGIEEPEEKSQRDQLNVIQAIPIQNTLSRNKTTTTTTTTDQISQPQPTQYPLSSTEEEKLPAIPPNKPYRPGPFPDLVKLIDSRLNYEKWHDNWWDELTGLTLDELWREYLRYYGR
ncbi:uncharacterized protein I206_102138 [Kwoniella pini CBS 10737]|uniref:Uncharacterized protein n=1 Tax=Kwoniella pini CBS 10737 TaxID=1296096 RepID=A0A1B9HUP4_9TREE|nr:uncharacterized protein I206_06769 [Kwoniella pini CBS 10737]OCF46995.1 hypothetical protein I206_06769 [Kwoniella pini CBS 10737]